MKSETHQQPRDSCTLCAVVHQSTQGAHRGYIATLAHSVVILNAGQGCLGWCVLVLKEHAEHAADLPRASEMEFFAEAALVGRAIRAAFPDSGAGRVPPRINYANLGNVVTHTHWHVVPRHADDPEPKSLPWAWPADRQIGNVSEETRSKVRDQIAREIANLSENKL